MVNSMAIEEGDKLSHYRIDVSIVVIRCSKFESKTTAGKLLYGPKRFLVTISYLLIYRSCDAYAFFSFIFHFWSKINKQSDCNKNVLVCIFKKYW